MRTSILFYIRWICLIIGTLGLAHVMAQPRKATLQPFNGDIPAVNTYYPVQVFQQNTRIYWLKNDRRVWSLDLTSRTWRRWPDLRLDSIPTFAGFSKTTNAFYVWSLGTGLVYQWEPVTGASVLISEPIDHKNQFGHAHFFRTADRGELVVFGGYGIWQYTNLIKYFDANNTTWKLYSYPKRPARYRLPSPRTDAMSIYDAKNDYFHVFSGSTTTYHRDDLSNDALSFDLLEYWVLDLTTGIWKQKRIYGNFKSYPREDNRPRIPFISKNFGAKDTLKRHFWYPVYVEQASNSVGLVLYDELIDLAFVTPIQVSYPQGKATLISLIYDFEKQDLLTLWVPLIPVGQDAAIQHVYAALPDSTALRTLIRSQVSKYQADERNQILFWILVTLLIVRIPTLYLQLKRSWVSDTMRVLRNPWAYLYPTRPQDRVVLQLCYLNEPVLFLNKLDVTSQFSSLSLRLLLWLIWKRFEGEAYILADDIESRFVGDMRNLDHIRKRRNSLIQRLNNELEQLLLPYPGCTLCMKDRIFLDDKRKREYFLEIRNVNIITDFETLFDRSSNPSALLTDLRNRPVDLNRILFPYREPWADEIIQAIQAKAEATTDPAT